MMIRTITMPFYDDWPSCGCFCRLLVNINRNNPVFESLGSPLAVLDDGTTALVKAKFAPTHHPRAREPPVSEPYQPIKLSKDVTNGDQPRSTGLQRVHSSVSRRRDISSRILDQRLLVSGSPRALRHRKVAEGSRRARLSIIRLYTTLARSRLIG